MKCIDWRPLGASDCPPIRCRITLGVMRRDVGWSGEAAGEFREAL